MRVEFTYERAFEFGHTALLDHWRRLQPPRGRRVSAAEPRCGECRMARIHLRLGFVLEHGVNSDQASFPSARLLAIVLRILADPRLYSTFSKLQASAHVGCAASKLHLAVPRPSDIMTSCHIFLCDNLSYRKSGDRVS